MKRDSIMHAKAASLLRQYLASRPFATFTLLVLVSASAILPAMGLDVMRRFTNTGLERGVGPELLELGAVYLAIAAFGIGFNFLFTVHAQSMGYRLLTDLNMRLFERVQRQSMDFFLRAPAGDLSNQFAIEAEACRDAFDVFTKLARNLAGAAAFAVVSLHMDPVSAIPALALLPIAAYYTDRGYKKAGEIAPRVQALNARISDELISSVQMGRDVRLCQREADQSARFNVLLGGMGGEIREAIEIRSRVSAVGSFLQLVGFTFLYSFSALRVLRGEITPGQFLAFATAMYSIFNPMLHLLHWGGRLKELSGTTSRLRETLAAEPSVKDEGRAELTGPVESLELERVGFTYPGAERPVFSRVSLKASRGDVVAIVGPNGAGKSTLLNLLPRFYDPTEGRISINGRELGAWTLKSLRARISLVSQETVLFDDTVAANIGYGRAGASQEEIARAAELSGAAEFIARLPQGYQTRVGERGGLLSGGQRQRIAIARAFLRDAPVLLLDEPTSALDAESREQLKGALERLMKDRIVFIVTHHARELPGNARILQLAGPAATERIANG
ncbi:MAG TPA: ABC transporter ATP-binding protein [Bdellovibrionales bacterium]|nr:ABC transporter ATP-binding protein [Bdellovibrionales bacterium]